MNDPSCKYCDDTGYIGSPLEFNQTPCTDCKLWWEKVKSPVKPLIHPLTTKERDDMTPEQIEGLKRIAEDGKTVFESNVVKSLLAALEESQQSAKNWEESYLSLHEKFREKRTELAEAQQTIAQQRKALERILNCTGIGYESAWRTSLLIAKEALGGNKEGSDKA